MALGFQPSMCQFIECQGAGRTDLSFTHGAQIYLLGIAYTCTPTDNSELLMGSAVNVRAAEPHIPDIHIIIH